MKFNIADILYYVNPFVFTIEKIRVVDISYDQGVLFYIEEGNGYLREEDLFDNVEEAVNEAIHGLNAFYNKRIQELTQGEF
jgi:hypothetical protein